MRGWSKPDASYDSYDTMGRFTEGLALEERIWLMYAADGAGSVLPIAHRRPHHPEGRADRRLS